MTCQQGRDFFLPLNWADAVTAEASHPIERVQARFSCGRNSGGNGNTQVRACDFVCSSSHDPQAGFTHSCCFGSWYLEKCWSANVADELAEQVDGS